MKTKKGQIYLVKGDERVFSKSGKFEVIGALLENDEIHIPEGKQIPFKCIENGELHFEKGNFEMLSHDTIPSSWYDTAKKIKKEGRKKIVILGEVDTGKSFFSIFLANRLFDKKTKVGIIDTDTGQSDIGAPGTVGFGVFDKNYFTMSDIPVKKQYFLGNHSPGCLFSIFLTGIYKISKYAEQHCDHFIVNTTGWTHGDGARCIKRAKLEIIDPDCVILMQRNNELEHLTAHLSKEKVMRLTVSRKATLTSQIIRKDLREKISRAYFKNSKEIRFLMKDIYLDRIFLGSGKKQKIEEKDILYFEKLPAWEGNIAIFKEDMTNAKKQKLIEKYSPIRYAIPSFFKNIFVGLADKDGFCLAVGSIQNFNFKNGEIEISTSIEKEKIKQVKSIQIGSLRYTKEGKEDGFLPQGVI